MNVRFVKVGGKRRPSAVRLRRMVEGVGGTVIGESAWKGA